jgi:flagellar M-ring protein FliF
VKAGLDNVLAVLRGLGTAKLAAIAGVGVLTLGLLGFLVFRGSEPPMALLYGDLDQRDAGQVVAALERARVPHRLGRGGTEILVPEDQVARMRLQLARDGLPAGGSVGYEIFDRQSGLSTTPFQQDINRLRALEGEIARSIRSIQGVQSARVHLVLPRREPFSRERGEAQASIVLQMRGSQRLDRGGVQATLHLVAAAVPGLRPQNVSIVDSRGELLARGGQALASSEGQAITAEERRRAQEMRIARGVEEMLERSLGPGRVRVEATVEFDAERVETREERFDPDNQVPRSTQSTTESSRNGEPQNVTVANQLPGAPQTQSGGPTSQESRQEETTNFEIGRTTRTTLRDQPVLRRQSVAVMVDGVVEPPETAGGPPRYRERTREELERVASLVRAAIGFDERRGDRVEVVSLRFAMELPGSTGDRDAGVLGSLMSPTLITRLAESALVALVAVLAILMLGRPLVRRINASLVPSAEAGLQPAVTAALPSAAVLQEGSAGPGSPGGSEEFVDMAMVAGQLRASSLQRVTELVDNHPDEALALVRRWMAPETHAQ